jgi:hypothetical protein
MHAMAMTASVMAAVHLNHNIVGHIYVKSNRLRANSIIIIRCRNTAHNHYLHTLCRHATAESVPDGTTSVAISTISGYPFIYAEHVKHYHFLISAWTLTITAAA